MSNEHPEITEKIRDWVSRQKMFFVATAPLSGDGMVNCSPKGMDTFRILDEHTVAYLDLTGSGVETVAHLKENGRIVVMFCGFEGAPQIVRFHGKGEVFEKGSEEYDGLVHHFGEWPGARTIIRIAVSRVSDSCGFSVPLYTYEGDREVLTNWAVKKGEEGVADYQRMKNRVSLDGLAGLEH